MGCAEVRELLSARLDGEDTPGEAALADAHLTGCAECAAWFETAARVTRLVRTGVVAEPDPAPDGLLETVLAAAPGRGWARTGRWLRAALGVLGFGQFLIGIGQIASLRMSAGIGSAGGMTSDHLLHESAAWNVAIGAGYVWIATRRGRPSGVLPILTAFVGVLLLLSISDLLSGEVVAANLLTHLFVVIGYVILLALRHPGFDAATPPGQRRWRLRPDEGFDDLPATSHRSAAGSARGATADSRRAA
jgi:predicted anti-sigma-YlaC factor YlaD